MYFWSRQEYTKIGYTVAAMYIIGQAGRIAYALIYEKKTGRTPTDEQF